jgi:hypothetical protein
MHDHIEQCSFSSHQKQPSFDVTSPCGTNNVQSRNPYNPKTLAHACTTILQNQLFARLHTQRECSRHKPQTQCSTLATLPAALTPPFHRQTTSLVEHPLCRMQQHHVAGPSTPQPSCVISYIRSPPKQTTQQQLLAGQRAAQLLPVCSKMCLIYHPAEQKQASSPYQRVQTHTGPGRQWQRGAITGY